MVTVGFSSLMAFMPEITLAVSGITLLMAGVFLKGSRAAEVVSLSSIIIILFTAYQIGTDPSSSVSIFSNMFLRDGFTQTAKLIVLTASLLVMIFSSGWLMGEGGMRPELHVLMLFSTLGMLLMISANDLLALYMGLELSSLALYVMAAFSRDSIKSTEAGLKYFVLGALASGMLLFGASLVYGFAGTTSFKGLADLFLAASNHADIAQVAFMPSLGVLVGLILVITGFCFKISAVPFHMWTPDVYEGAPTPVTAFMATASKAAAITLFIRVLMGPFGPLIAQWQQVIVVAAAASMVIGALGAIAQTSIKRLLAYSSIGHVGFMLVGIATGTLAGVHAVLIYLGLYVLMSAGTFACLLSLKRGSVYIETISDLAGLSKSHPRVAAALAVFMFSMAGIPPLAGFFGKMFIFLAAVQAGWFALAILGVLASVVSCFYYLKVIKIMYFDEALELVNCTKAIDTRIVIVITAIINVLFFLFPSPWLHYTKQAASVMVAP